MRKNICPFLVTVKWSKLLLFLSLECAADSVPSSDGHTAIGFRDSVAHELLKNH